MPKRKSEIGRLLGRLATIEQTILNQVLAKGGGDDEILRLAKPEGEETLAKIVEIILEGSAERFMVDYACPLKEIDQYGEYGKRWFAGGWEFRDHISRPTSKKSGSAKSANIVEVLCRQVSFGSSMWAYDACKLIAEYDPWVVATIREVATYLKDTYLLPEPMYALGSCVGPLGGRHLKAPFIHGFDLSNEAYTARSRILLIKRWW